MIIVENAQKFYVFKKNAYICNTEKTIKTYNYGKRN